MIFISSEAIRLHCNTLRETLQLQLFKKQQMAESTFQFFKPFEKSYLQ